MERNTSLNGAIAPQRDGSPVTSPSGINPPPAPRPAAPVSIDDSSAVACYANYCRLSGTPEEVVFNFGLNQRQTQTSGQAVAVMPRVVTGWYTAKRLLRALPAAVERHEATFGVLEPDVQKRLQRV